jgi:hypothetical protein
LRLELLRPPGHNVDVAVQQHRQRRVGRPHLCGRDGQPADTELLRLDLAGLEPALDEAGALLDPLRSGGVVAD